MKFAIITGIEEYRKDIIDILKKSKVFSFSINEVLGFKDESELNIETNWFGSELNLNASLIFNIILKDELTPNLFKLVEEFNNKNTTESRIHIAILNIEKSNEI